MTSKKAFSKVVVWETLSFFSFFDVIRPLTSQEWSFSMRKLEGKEDRVLWGIYSLVTVGEFFATFFICIKFRSLL